MILILALYDSAYPVCEGFFGSDKGSVTDASSYIFSQQWTDYSHKYIALFNVSMLRYVQDIDASTKVSSFLQKLLDDQWSHSQRIQKKDRLLYERLRTKEMEPRGTESSISSIYTMSLPALYLWSISPVHLLPSFPLEFSTLPTTCCVTLCSATRTVREQEGRLVYPSKQRGNSHN
jgi:hypothetical protein